MNEKEKVIYARIDDCIDYIINNEFEKIVDDDKKIMSITFIFMLLAFDRYYFEEYNLDELIKEFISRNKLNSDLSLYLYSIVNSTLGYTFDSIIDRLTIELKNNLTSNNYLIVNNMILKEILKEIYYYEK